MKSEADSWLEAVIRFRRPLVPIATQAEPKLAELSEIRAVIFDVYGTLVVSGSGDVGTADSQGAVAAIGHAAQAMLDARQVTERIDLSQFPSHDAIGRQIRRSNQLRRSESCPQPEVDILEVWRQALQESGLGSVAASVAAVTTLAAEYEARANPTWPMPGAADLVRQLASANVPLGIVSNAQTFTVPLVENLIGGKLAERGFDLDLCIFSYRFRQAKPAPRLFAALQAGLCRRGISPHKALYVGNDMLNDIWAASQAGLRTAWFAGDGRSLRARSDDARCRDLRPDLIVTDLNQLSSCLFGAQS